jgi:PII-like signaling protein
LDDTSFTTWTTLYFLIEIDDLVPEVGEPFFYQDYLQTDLQDAVNILLKDFTSCNLAGENNLERRICNDNEKAFQKKVIKKLLETILPVTIHLQTTIDREEKIKKTAPIMSAQFKKNAITMATEATAIAIGNTPLNN